MSKTERKILDERFQAMTRKGLRDMKFIVGEVNEATVEQVCGDVNRILDKAGRDKYTVLDKWNDSQN